MDIQSDKKTTTKLKVDPDAVRRLEFCVRKWATMSLFEQDLEHYELIKKQHQDS